MHDQARPNGPFNSDGDSRSRLRPEKPEDIPNTLIPALAEGATLWLTGLPCSGKTTLAVRIGVELERRGHRVEVLDADVLRATVCRGLGFSKQDRDENVARIGWICEALNRHGVVAIAAVVSPYRAARARLRSSLPRFVEIYVSAPLDVCMERDVKGLYARARRGEIAHFTGIDDPYEEPLAPEIVVETARMSVDESALHILDTLEALSFTQAPHQQTTEQPSELRCECLDAP
ncbi:MAG: adenylyl-sulfate kinase [Acidobacteriaceae bacterium]|jgi:adenylylsulfate kinase